MGDSLVSRSDYCARRWHQALVSEVLRFVRSASHSPYAGVFAKHFSEEAFGSCDPKARISKAQPTSSEVQREDTELRSTHRVQASQNELAEPYEYNNSS